MPRVSLEDDTLRQANKLIEKVVPKIVKSVAFKSISFINNHNYVDRIKDISKFRTYLSFEYHICMHNNDMSIVDIKFVPNIYKHEYQLYIELMAKANAIGLLHFNKWKVIR